MTGDVRNEAGLGLVVKDLLPQGTRRVEVFRLDLGEEGDCLADELTVDLVEVDRAFAEADGLDG